MIVLLVLRLTRDDWVDRVFKGRAQRILTLELIDAARALRKHQDHVSWNRHSTMPEALDRLDTAAKLIEAHPRLTKQQRNVKMRSSTSKMRALARNVQKMREDLCYPGPDTVRDVRLKVLYIAVLVDLGHFGSLDVPILERGATAGDRFRAVLARLAGDLPLALVPLAVIPLFDAIGLNTPENHAARGALVAAGATFAMFVICRAIDPTVPTKVSLTSALLKILNTWRPAARGDDKADDTPPSPAQPAD